MGELVINLPKKFDDFDENDVVKLNNRLDLYVNDADTGSDGKRIYSGFISRYEPFIQDRKEGVTIRCLGYASKLTTSILKNGTQTELKTDTASGLTTGGAASACEVNTVIKATIDRYRLEASNPIINYSSTSTEDCGNTLTYTFNALFYSDAIEKCMKATPVNWYWYIDANNIFNFKPKPSVATHNFYLGKDFRNIKVEKNMESVVNSVLVSNNSTILKRFSDSDSIVDFDDRWEILTDERVTVEATANNIGNSEIAGKKDEDVRVIIEIIDNNGGSIGYDIESIEPGHTCKFIGFNDITQKTLTNNMFIKGVDYTPDTVNLELESLRPSIARELSDTNEKVALQESTNRLTTYTT